ncbi:MAG: phosphatidylserine/phosphatidylglycerophosphate/cardiolipin synthase family protein [Pseudomonadota bacterium]|nr:phosphatidylserine/phosphatidylglycerophosphate/cardiolipin synthase family protein [Pseudomonadota bacterium]
MGHKNDHDSANPPCGYADEAPFTWSGKGHEFTFYPAGSDRLSALIEHIESAQTSLHLFYYMFQDDRSGNKVLDALVAAAKRGVEVHLIVDAFGSDPQEDFFAPIIEAGGRFSTFSPRWNVRFLIRNHQKFAIVDKTKVMTGGSNVSDHYFASPEDNGWCDLGVSITGPVVERFYAWFDCLCDWVEGSGSQLRRLRRMIRCWEPGNDGVELLVGGPSVRLYGWAHRLRADLRKARKVDQVSAYFTPPSSIRRKLRQVARRGELRMITAGKSDIDATIAAARLHYKSFLKAGAQIAEFRACKLHMKLMIVDDACYFGSANMDKRSWRVNVELMVRVEDADLAQRMRGFIDHVESGAEPITREWHARHATKLARFKWRAAYALAMLDYWLSRRLNR